jgi:sulfoxide reductase catalytic subunit YedY
MEVTSEPIYRSRREWLRALGLGAVALTTGCESGAAPDGAGTATQESIPGKALAIAERGQYVIAEPMTRYKDATGYNNFYEFGTGKGDPAQASAAFHAHPWSSKSPGTRKSPGDSRSRTCSSRIRSRSASIACAASKAGRW